MRILFGVSSSSSSNVWTELMLSLKIAGEGVDPEVAAHWRELHVVWQLLGKLLAARTSVRFVIHVPASVESARKLVAFLETLEGNPVVGVGQRGTEKSAKQV